MDKSFKLSDRQHQNIYSRIEKEQFTGTKPVENPRVIITGGQPRTVEHIEKNQLTDRMEVYNRDGDQLYFNEVKNNTWQKELEALKAIEQERQRMPSLRQIEKFKYDWREIKDGMKSRDASLKAHEQAREVERKLEKNLDKQLEKAKQTKQKDVARLPQKEKPQERDREGDLSR